MTQIFASFYRSSDRRDGAPTFTKYSYDWQITRMSPPVRGLCRATSFSGLRG